MRRKCTARRQVHCEMRAATERHGPHGIMVRSDARPPLAATTCIWRSGARCLQSSARFTLYAKARRHPRRARALKAHAPHIVRTAVGPLRHGPGTCTLCPARLIGMRSKAWPTRSATLSTVVPARMDDSHSWRGELPIAYAAAAAIEARAASASRKLKATTEFAPPVDTARWPWGRGTFRHMATTFRGNLHLALVGARACARNGACFASHAAVRPPSAQRDALIAPHAQLACLKQRKTLRGQWAP